MKAVLLSAVNQVSVIEHEEPIRSFGKSVVKVLACGICGTDRHIYRGEYPSSKPVI